MSKAIPVGDRVLVKDLEPELSVAKRAQRAGLFAVVLPENEPKPTSGTVVAVGSGTLIQEACAVGDKVLFSQHAGIGVQLEGEEYRMLEWREISLVIKPDEVATSPQVPQVQPPSPEVPPPTSDTPDHSQSSPPEPEPGFDHPSTRLDP